MHKNRSYSCVDARVMRSASCWSDHMLVRAKLVFCARAFRSQKSSSSRRRPCTAHQLHTKPDVQSKFQHQINANIQPLCDRSFCDDLDPEEDWATIPQVMLEAAEKSVGHDRRAQQDWFVAASHTIQPLIDQKNIAHNLFLKSPSEQHRCAFRASQRAVRDAVRLAKENWICDLASRAEDAVHNGRARWGCIRALSSVFAGRKAIPSTSIIDEEGNALVSPAAVTARWGRHFSGLFNVAGTFNDETVEAVPQRQVRNDLDKPPTLGELTAAIKHMKLGKASGSTGILPEMVACGGENLHICLLNVMVAVWHSGDVVNDWRDAEIVPVPKKGNLRLCDNWRGISLLDIVGKLFARVIQDRVQMIAEDVLPDSQCGFRKGRGCNDMVFVARQLIEKSVEHDDQLCVLFVDLRQAYDSIPRTSLWSILSKLGVPPKMLKVIQSLHEGMSAAMRVSTASSDSFPVNNGLRQGCTLAPVLFNLYFAVVMDAWRSTCKCAGIPVSYKIGRKLVGDRTAKSRLSQCTITESQFADDAALYTHSVTDMDAAAALFVTVATQFGLTVSFGKTKCMVINADPPPTGCLTLADGDIEIVNEFTYLGSCITRGVTHGTTTTTMVVPLFVQDGPPNSSEKAIKKFKDLRTCTKASRSFGALRSAVFGNRHISVSTKTHVYSAVVLSTLLYGCESWAVKATDTRRLSVFHNRCARFILGRQHKSEQWNEHLSTDAVILGAGWFAIRTGGQWRSAVKDAPSVTGWGMSDDTYLVPLNTEVRIVW